MMLEAVDGRHASNLLKQYQPDLVILDLGLPDMDGQNWLISLRAYFQTPVIILSARFETEEVVKALENGADDYLKKPFDMPELVARIKRLLNVNLPSTKSSSEVYKFANMQVAIDDYEVHIDGKLIHLSKKEFQLLSILVRNAGKLITQTQLLKEIWGEYFADEVQYLRVYIGQLRKKLADCHKQPLITTESGVGYRFAQMDS
ncbi:response regulator transcription factor [Facilibium subflavum]|uniref:response regulator transcription factor n=1 Tax=Facilibium subflavum TaxID=2219058 RepID=UPI001F33DB9F|nr:response regulator transcription factor [Facilibium subflavum]